MTIFVTGGCGFIGSQFIRDSLARFPETRIVNFDKLTYAGNPANLASVQDHPSYSFFLGDVCDTGALLEAIPQNADAIVHFAAESHVDRSILGADAFVQTNVVGTQKLLDAARERRVKRFLHISTDEVGGSMGPQDWFCEDSPLDPRSPYAASKAAAEHLVRAAGATFGLDYVITRSSNNYGPYQFPEKLVPLAICNARDHQCIPVYGNGLQMRDWVHVDDNCRALQAVLSDGHAGHTYHIGSGTPTTNRQLLQTLLHYMDRPLSLLQEVPDRPGHDIRYAVDCHKIQAHLNWVPAIPLHDGLLETIGWYSENPEWVETVRSGQYRRYYQRQYGASVQPACVA